MLNELRCGENIKNRRLATWLTEEEYKSFESDCGSQERITEELRDKSDELKRYEDKLHKPLLTTTKLNVFARETVKDKSIKFRKLSESHCEGALEILQGTEDADPSLHL